MNVRPLKVLFVFIIGLVIATQLFAQADVVKDLYFKAKTSTMQQDWDHALELYTMIVEHYPNSPYYDESRFWIGYCYEKIDDGLPNAFKAFDDVVKNTPQSSWKDDALQHQIEIAEKLAHSPDSTYKVFLIDLLQSKDSFYQIQAAMALARNGYDIALPYLSSIPQDEETWEEAQLLIREIEQDTTGILDNIGVKTDLEFNKTAKQPSVSLKPDGKQIRFYAKQRFSQYQKLTKPDDNWEYQELIDFGLWHILRSDLFDYYSVLNQEEKEQWIRKFWFSSDPTPTTELNEARQEFERRVMYAREHYSYFDNLAGHYYAPWDARGEVYIKYGKPQSVKVRGMEEYWYYPQYRNLQFMIRRYVTNIFGRAIFSRYGSKWRMWSDPQKVDAKSYDLVYKPVFIYHHKYIYDNVEKLSASIKLIDGEPVLCYAFPADEFKIQKDDLGYFIDYTEKYAIYNSSYFQIHYTESKKRIAGPKNELQNKTIEQEIPLNLAPGDYYIGLRLEDKSAKKMSLQKQSFSIKNVEP